MKCTVDGVEYERIENKTCMACQGCAAEGWSEEALTLCSRLEDCTKLGADEDFIWVKVEHE